MNYKGRVFGLFLAIAFLVCWLVLNHEIIKGFQCVNEDTVFRSMMNLVNGYWNQKQFVIFYMLMYLIMVFLFTSNHEDQLLIRMSRSQFLMKQMIHIAKITLYFQLIFATVGLVLLLLFVKISLFGNITFFSVFITECIQEYSYYLLFGMFFYFMYLIFHNKAKAFLVTAIISLLQFGCLVWFKYYIWVPIYNIHALDSYYMENITNSLRYTVDFIKIFILMMIIILLSFQIVKKKDVINYED